MKWYCCVSVVQYALLNLEVNGGGGGLLVSGGFSSLAEQYIQIQLTC